MPIDVTERDSDGWWLDRLTKQLAARQTRLVALNDRYEGRPPLPTGMEHMAEAYRAFVKKSRSNYTELVVESLRERLQVASFQTAAAGDVDADERAQEIWTSNVMDVEAADVHEHALSMGDGYVIVGRDDDGEPLITAEDPRQVITAHDPVQHRRVRAAAKLFHDDDQGVDLAFLYRPGRVRVAFRPRRSATQRVRFDPRSWTWDDDASGELPHEQVPVVRFRNRRGIAEFEPHVDLLDRINHMILQRLVIATSQAFRQRAIKGLPARDEAGNELDWSDVFTLDPGALWQVPEGVEFWESSQGDLTPILTSVRDDVKELAAVTRTPLGHLMPDAANQSAEGAAFQREGLEFKADDRIVRFSEAWKDVMSLAFLVAGDDERAARSSMEVLWRSSARRSLAERANAASQAQDIPWRHRMELIWEFSHTRIDEMEAERAADQLAAAELLGGGPEPGPAPEQGSEGGPG